MRARVRVMVGVSRMPFVYLKSLEMRATGEAVAAEESGSASARSVGLIAA